MHELTVLSVNFGVASPDSLSNCCLDYIVGNLEAICTVEDQTSSSASLNNQVNIGFLYIFLAMLAIKNLLVSRLVWIFFSCFGYFVMLTKIAVKYEDKA